MLGKVKAGKRSEKRPLLETGLGKTLFAALVLIVACGLGYWFWESRQPDYFYYRDMQMAALDGVDRNTYIPQAFTQQENGWVAYPDALQGIDVSVYQGDVDWQAVADAGVDFAIIRVGYRGYSQGAIQGDANFQKNMEGALEAGLDVGVYFFSQATTVREAEEEADYVLETIRSYPVTYPVVFDWEFVDGQTARTDEMEGEHMTECAKTFCELVDAAGYTPMVYFNQEQGYLYYQLDQLDQFQFWLAEYDQKPDFYYDFAMWQYTHTGKVPGIQGNVDLNLAFRDLSKQ